MKRLQRLLGGLAIGLVNGLFGAGGGMLTVPLLGALGLTRQECHATSIALILPLSALSAALYLRDGMVEPAAALPYLGGGVLGAAAGAMLLGKLSPRLLKRLFGVLILFAAVRMWLR